MVICNIGLNLTCQYGWLFPAIQNKDFNKKILELLSKKRDMPKESVETIRHKAQGSRRKAEDPGLKVFPCALSLAPCAFSY